MLFGKWASRKSEARYPTLWNGLVYAQSPSVQSPSGATLYDFSSRNIHASITGGATWSRSGDITSIDTSASSTQWVEIPLMAMRKLYSTQRFSIMLWHRTLAAANSAPQDKVLFALNGGYAAVSLYYDGTDNNVSWTTSGSFGNRLTSSIRTFDATWHCIVATYDLGQTSLYVDGLLAGSKTQTLQDFSAATLNSRIGSTPNSGNHLPGSIGQCAAWNRPLTVAETTLLTKRRNAIFVANKSITGGQTINRRRRLLVGASS